MREKAGLRQEDVGKKLNIDQTTVCKWEKGASKPLKKYRKKLAKLYGCTVDDLLRQDDEKEGA
ncbi:MAG: helix-turn-helix transcriptional regulator [Dysosmobacter sp.]|nr:helix-turn-helix transcriptional regulator [Dysosmobacter sp.]